MAKLKTQAGRLTAYGLACGYIEQFEYKRQRVTLWHEGGPLYHVKEHDFDLGKRISWESFEKLSEARAAYDLIVDRLSREKIKESKAFISLS